MNELGLERCLEHKEKAFSKRGKQIYHMGGEDPTLEVDYTLPKLC